MSKHKDEEIVFSPQQETFFTTAGPGQGSILLVARAGCGKTESLRQWANRVRGTGIATSFSKATTGELARKMPSRFDAMTMHSAGRKGLVDNGLWQDMDKNKNYSIVSAYFEQISDDSPIKEAFADVMKLVSVCKSAGVGFPHLGDQCISDIRDLDYVSDLADYYDLSFSQEIYQALYACLEKHRDISLNQGIHDFDDMLWIPVLRNLSLPKGIILIVDEAQDLSGLQHLMLTKMLMPYGRVIAAGDDRQAIYAFRGALSNSFDLLGERFNARRLPLNISYRCPKEVVTYAQQYVPDIESAPGAPQGLVQFHESICMEDLPRQILCRNNGPIVQLALGLLASGYSAEVRGRDIGKGLISLTKRISKRNLTSDEFLGRLQIWADKETARKPSSKHRIADKVMCLRAIATAHKDMRGIQSHLEKLYPDPGSRNYRPAEFQLGTIHSAKGLEWPKVGILDPQLMPSPYARQDWELTQEANLAYVAATRAQEELHFFTSENIT